MRHDTRSVEERTRTWGGAGHHVHGHPRSGTHYLMSVLNENFIQRPGPFRDAFGHNRLASRHLHGLPDQSDATWFDEGRHFYIWRSFDAVAKSILRMPERFGIVAKLSLEEFKKATWKDIYEPGVRWAWKQVHELSEEARIERGNTTAFGVTFYMEAINWNTYEFWQHHVHTWRSFAASRDNIMMLRYEELQTNFPCVLRNVAKWLGSSKTDFRTVDRKVSGQPL